MYVLVYILIIVGGGFLLCMPAFQKHTTLKSDYDTIEAQWMTTKAGIVEYKDLDKQIEEATTLYNEQLKKFYIADETHAEDIDQLITSLSTNHYLKPMALQISEVSEEEVMSYQDFIQEQAKKNETENNTGETADQEETNTTTAKVYNVSLTVSGTITNLQAMINDVTNMRTLKVSSVSYSSQEEATKTMTISFVVYMI